MNKKFYTAKYDAVFKAIFCNPKNEDLLKTLLERCLNQKLSIIKVETPEILKKNVYMKNKTLDVLVKAENKLINIELNSEYYHSLRYRNSAYIFEKYAELIKVGDDYKNMPEVVQINFTIGLPKEYPPVCKYIRIDPEENIVFDDKLTTYEFNIDKIKKLCYNGDEKYNYIAIIDFEKEDLEKYCRGDEYMEKFEKEVKRLNTDVEFTEFLSAEEDAKKVHNTLIAEAEERGNIQGIEQGKTKERLELVKKLLNKAATDDFIIEVTEISKEELEKIKQELN